jgi:hypothetical protein
MFDPSNKILIVDDIEGELITLAKVFLSNGVACRTILYDGNYNTPLEGVRVLFLDIKILGKAFDLNQEIFDYTKDRDLSAVFNDLAFAIQSCISKDNGPYALIFWSNNIKVVPNFISYVRERYPDLASPILIDAIDKTTFIGKSIEEFNVKINQIFENKPIKLLFEFENNCNNAAIQTVNELFKIIPKNIKPEDRLWANNIGFSENFDLIFSSIATKTLGTEHAKLNVDRAVVEALLPIFNHRIINNSIIESNWSNSLRAIDSNNIKYPEGFTEGVINTIFHIDTSSNITSNIRGAVYEFHIEKSFLQKFFNNRNPFNLIPYFKNMEDKTKLYFTKFFSFSKETPEADKNQIRADSKFIVIEISASCDFSQNKSRNNKFVLGLMTPKFKKDYIDHKMISDSVFYKEIPEFSMNGKEFNIWINLNFVISDFSENKNFGKPLFIFKKEIMDMIGNRYANHISRIGITSF